MNRKRAVSVKVIRNSELFILESNK
jgi:hypothetical protein